MSPKLIPVGVATWAKLAQPAPRQRSTRYPVTPTLSVDAVQTRSIRFVLATVAPSPDGAVGAVVSGAACVVAETMLEYALRFPAASAARTR